MKPFVVILTLLLVLLPMLAACGDDKQDDRGGEDEAVALPETFEGTVGIYELSFKYPEGWLVQMFGTSTVALATNQATVDELDEGVPNILAGQRGMAFYPQLASNFEDDDTLDSLAAQYVQQASAYGELGEIESIRLNNHETRRFSFNGETIEGWFYLVQMENIYVLIGGLTANGEADRDAQTLFESIIASVEVSSEVDAESIEIIMPTQAIIPTLMPSLTPSSGN